MANLTVKNASGTTVEIKATGDGSSGDPFVTEQSIPGVGNPTTTVAADGDLQTIDTAAERLSLNPTANTSGAASNKHSGNFLLRWLAGLLQDVLNRLPSVKGQNAMADSVSVAIASNQSSIPVSDNSGSLTVDAPVSTPVFVRLSDGSSAIANLSTNLVNISGSAQSSTNPLFVRPSISVARITCTQLVRPADTTAYSINDSISNSTSAPAARTFTGAASANGGGGEIVRAFLKSSDAITGSVRVYLLNGNSAPTAVNDNSTYAFSDLQTNCIGYIDFAAMVTGRVSEGLLSSGSTMPFTCGGSTTSLFGQVMCLIAFTPTSGQTFDFELWVVDRN